jgi:sec-independent protein translocase protein TatA
LLLLEDYTVDEPWVWAIILLLAVLLFGSKRLPDAARGIGRSLRIFKAETKGLLTDDEQAAAAKAPQQIAAPAPVAPPVAVVPQAVVPQATVPAPVETPVAVPVTGADQPDPQ